MDFCCKGGYAQGPRLLPRSRRHGIGFAFHVGDIPRSNAAALLDLLAVGRLRVARYPGYSAPGRAGMYPFPLAAEIFEDPRELVKGN